jgi:hypothetical protein
MKNPITTKDLGLLNELCRFEQWAATKLRYYYEQTTDEVVKELFKQYSLDHNARHDALFKYLKANQNAGGKQQ